MFGAPVQLAELVVNNRLQPFLIFFCLTWSIFLLRLFFARRHRAILDRPDFDTNIGTSAIVFTYRDDPALLRQSLESIKDQGTPFTEVIVAVDASETEDRLDIVRQSGFRIYVDDKGNKRDAFAGALLETTGEIIVHLAGDTIYPPDMTTNALIAFASDPKIGGVAFSQGIYDHKRNLVRRFANVMYGLRFALTYRALSTRKSLLCTTGETGFFRRAPIEKNMEAFTHEFFMGQRCIIGDDRFLTSMVLREGYSVVLQESRRQVLTDCPNTLSGFVRQQVRWYRSNQRYSLKTLFGWIPGRPFLKAHLAAFMVLPYLWLALLAWWIVNARFGIYPVEIVKGIPLPIIVAWIVGGFLLTMLLKTSPYFFRHRQDLWLFPVYVPFVTFVIMPCFVYALLTINDQGSWGTKGRSDQLGTPRHGGVTLGILALALVLVVPLMVLELVSPHDTMAIGAD